MSTHEHENWDAKHSFRRASRAWSFSGSSRCRLYRSRQPPSSRRVASGKLQRASTRVLWAVSSGDWCAEGRARNGRWSGGAGAPFGPITASVAA
eukprot:scaffold29847_cov68-Phaeocystis_antarctica.AAC.6